MARTLTCTDERWNCDYLKECEKPCQHHVGQTASDARPPLATAVAVVHSADFVGVLELLPEALCVIEYRKRGTLGPECVCAAGDAVAFEGWNRNVPSSASIDTPTRAKKRVAHVMNSRRQRAARKISVADAPPDVLKQLDDVLSVDLRVYRAAVLRVLCDLRALEEATGKPVICHSRLAKLRNKTGYIPGLWDGIGLGSALTEWAEARRAYEPENEKGGQGQVASQPIPAGVTPRAAATAVGARAPWSSDAAESRTPFFEHAATMLRQWRARRVTR